MNNPDQLLQLRILLNQLTVQIFASLETVTKVQAEIKLQLRTPGPTLDESERVVLSELLETRKRMDEQLTAILSRT